MAEQDRPFVDRVWEFTKDLSVRVSRKAEKHWKINTLRVEIASIKHRVNVKYKELGRYVFESMKADVVGEESYSQTVGELFDELNRLEGEILDREQRIETLEVEMSDEYAGHAEAPDSGEAPRPEDVVATPPPIPDDVEVAKDAPDPPTDAGGAEGDKGEETSQSEKQAAGDGDAGTPESERANV